MNKQQNKKQPAALINKSRRSFGSKNWAGLYRSKAKKPLVRSPGNKFPREPKESGQKSREEKNWPLTQYYTSLNLSWITQSVRKLLIYGGAAEEMKLACIGCSHQSHTHTLDLPRSLSHAATHSVAPHCTRGNMSPRQSGVPTSRFDRSTGVW
ncbi:hypothetical protein QQF64_019251 [Cirrhinus molitorella]|uniref:Uncharacterized protein n=1 Tax=Cirrhinus molitorella TaxID=172907 RepID=A0ABR3LGH8_9TELE